jgi:hypothetical protein
VFFQSILQPVKLALEKPTRSNDKKVEYQIPNSSVYLRYLKIIWTANGCKEHGERLKVHPHAHNESNV